jgi:hypothetical protein
MPGNAQRLPPATAKQPLDRGPGERSSVQQRGIPPHICPRWCPAARRFFWAAEIETRRAAIDETRVCLWRAQRAAFFAEAVIDIVDDVTGPSSADGRYHPVVGLQIWQALSKSLRQTLAGLRRDVRPTPWDNRVFSGQCATIVATLWPQEGLLCAAERTSSDGSSGEPVPR